MDDAIAVLNAGSSSIKFSLFALRDDALELTHRGQIEGLFTAPRFVARDRSGRVLSEKSWAADVSLGHASALAHLLEYLCELLSGQRLLGIGHRIVHGGTAYSQPIRLDAAALEALERQVPLAPLHQPHNLAPIRQLLESAPDLPQVACFDTSFHCSNPQLAKMFALPYEMYEQGVRRYGFHGLSYEYVASVLGRFDEGAAQGRCVVLHLGNGSSMCALHAGRSIATTMGFTAADGLPMGTRCGALDPGVLLYLMDQRGMSARQLEDLLYHQSGMLGVSGVSSDMRALLSSEAPRAKLAVDLYCYRIGRELGSLAAALGGIDAIVFTAGIGENAALVRANVCRDAAWLGLELDIHANETGGPRLSARNSRVSAWVIPTDEESMIARHTRTVLAV